MTALRALALVALILFLARRAPAQRPKPCDFECGGAAPTQESLLAAIRERLIDFASLNWAELGVVGATCCLLLAIPAVLALGLVASPWPGLSFDSGFGSDYQVKWPLFVLVSIALVLGECLVLAGSLHGRWYLASFVLLGLWAESVYFFVSLGLSAALLITTVWAARVQWARRHQRAPAGWIPAFAMSCALAVAVESATYLPAWSHHLLPQLIVGHILGALAIGVGAILLMHGADFAEIIQVVSLVVTERLGSRRWLTVTTLVTALLLGLVAMREATPATAPVELIILATWLTLPGAAVAAIMWLLLRSLGAWRQTDDESTERSVLPDVPVLAIGVSAAAVVLWVALATLAAVLVFGTPSEDQLIVAFGTTALVPAVLLLTVWLAWRRRSNWDRRVAANAYLLLVIAPICYAILLVVTAPVAVAAASALSIEVRLSPTSESFIPYLQLTAAVLTIGILGWRLGRRALPRRPRREPTDDSGLVRSLLVLNLSLAGVGAVVALINGGNNLGGISVFIAGILLVVPLAWDLLTSGRTITNPDPPSFPRQARVFTYCGYLLLAAALGLAASTLELGGSGQFLKRGTEALVVVGLLYLGVPLVLTVVILQTRRGVFR